jgi:hypothetical protein
MTRSRHPSLTKLRTSVTPQPASAGSSPTSGNSRRRQPSGSPTQYRVEERTRTIYVQSEVHPSLWSPDTLDQMFGLGSPQSSATAFSPEHVHRSRSWTEKQIFVFPESEAASYPSSPLKPTSASYSRRPSRSEGSMPSPSSRNDFDNSRRSPLNVRQKILFYHKHDPYYGFTNFSSHPVVYNNRTYPTSEHLFQSFKVGVLPPRGRLLLTCFAVPGPSSQSGRAHSDMLRPSQCRLFRSSSFPAGSSQRLDSSQYSEGADSFRWFLFTPINSPVTDGGDLILQVHTASGSSTRAAGNRRCRAG